VIRRALWRLLCRVMDICPGCEATYYCCRAHHACNKVGDAARIGCRWDGAERRGTDGTKSFREQPANG
jgi:hypothetical protein